MVTTEGCQGKHHKIVIDNNLGLLYNKAEKEEREGTFSCKAKLTEKFAALVSIGAVGGSLFSTKRVCRKSIFMIDRVYAINRVIALQMKTGVAICVAADILSGRRYYKDLLIDAEELICKCFLRHIDDFKL